MTTDLCGEIKRNVDLAEYVRSCGIELKKHGQNDLKGLCPFHDDKNPSLIISPRKQLFNCPVCGAGGSVIDFAAKLHKCSVSEAIKRLKKEKMSPTGAGAGTGDKAATPQNMPAVAPLPLERANELLERAVSFYEKTFSDSPKGKKYLESRGVTDMGLFGKHRIGLADGSLLKALPSSGNILDELKNLGILLENESERFKNCVVFPMFDVEGRIVTLYGRSLSGKRHVFLPDRPTGLWNVGIVKTYPEVVLVEGALDGLSLESSGVPNVIAVQGTNGFSGGDIQVLKNEGATKITLLLDGDKAGQAASLKLAERLSSSFSCTVLTLPDNHDPSSFFQEFGSEKLLSFISSAAGTAALSPAEASPPAGGTNSPLPAGTAEKTPSSSSSLRASVSSVVNIPDGFSVQFDLRKYEILGLERKNRSLKATVRASKAGKLHVDTIDFYSSRARRQLCQELTMAFDELPETIEGDVAKLLRICEQRSGDTTKKENDDLATNEKELSDSEKKAAESFGRSPDLVDNVLSDFARCGLVGEENNKLLCYLAMTSRKMIDPLCVLILSSSGAGKTALQDTALGFCPPEDLVKLTNLSGKALFYKERTSLKHKILAIEEGAGAEDASYAIRNLISSDGLTSEVAVRDPVTGKLTTMANTVEGPTAVFVTSTNPDVDPETRSRFLVTGIDESREQTRKILEFQRQKHSLSGLETDLETEKIKTLHRNFQRLLKPLRVVNPLVDKLFYGDDRLQARRAQPQYLNIVSAVAFLRQMSKKINRKLSDGGFVEYVEVDLEDVTIANKLAVEILGRSLDELSIPARNLLELIEKMLDERLTQLAKSEPDNLKRRSDLTFTRRDVREFAGWSNYRTHTHLKELIDLEHVIIESGRSNSLQHYRLLYDGQGKDGHRFIPGVKNVAEILGLKKIVPDD